MVVERSVAGKGERGTVTYISRAKQVTAPLFHFFLTQLSHLFCARVRQPYDAPGIEQPGSLTIEQVRSAINTWLSAADLKPVPRQERYKQELNNQHYYQRRNQQARKSHPKTTITRLHQLGIDVNKIKSCIT